MVKRNGFRTLAIMALVVGLSLPGMDAWAQARVLLNGNEYYGKSYGEWSAKWWKWAYSTPEKSNPMSDQTGEYCEKGQKGDVWFLAGIYEGLKDEDDFVVRDCTVPAGKALFFPIVNLSWVTLPEDTEGEDPRTWFQENEFGLRDLLAAIIDGAYDLNCTVDAGSLAGDFSGMSIYRTFSPIFNVYMPGDSIDGSPKGKYGPCVDDGYYIMLAPLSEGKHKIEFTATLPFFDDTIFQHVIYNLNIVRRKGKHYHH